MNAGGLPIPMLRGSRPSAGASGWSLASGWRRPGPPGQRRSRRPSRPVMIRIPRSNARRGSLAAVAELARGRGNLFPTRLGTPNRRTPRPAPRCPGSAPRRQDLRWRGPLLLLPGRWLAGLACADPHTAGGRLRRGRGKRRLATNARLLRRARALSQQTGASSQARDLADKPSPVDLIAPLLMRPRPAGRMKTARGTPAGLTDVPFALVYVVESTCRPRRPAGSA